MKNKNIKKPECPDCKSKQVLYRKTNKTYWCRVCGSEWLRNNRNKNS